VDELGVRVEDHGPARLADAVAEIHLLAVHEVGGIEAADRLRGLPPDEQHGALEHLDLAHARVVEPAAVEGVQGARARSEPAQEEVLRGDPPERRVPAHGRLERAVGVAQARPDDPGPRVCLAEGRQPLDRVAHRPGVRVEEQEPAPGGDLHADVVRGPEADVLLELDEPHRGKALPHECRAPVRRGVVHDHHLVPATGDGVEAALEVLARVEGDDDDGDAHEAGAAGRRLRQRRMKPPGSEVAIETA
jgi:hypothetical protein